MKDARLWAKVAVEEVIRSAREDDEAQTGTARRIEQVIRMAQLDAISEGVRTCKRLQEELAHRPASIGAARCVDELSDLAITVRRSGQIYGKPEVP